MSKLRGLAVCLVVVLLLGAVLSPAALAEGKRVRVLKFDGVVTAAPVPPVGEDPSDLGEWTIDDDGETRIVTVDEETNINETRGELAVGAPVEVVAKETEDGGLLALVIRVTPPKARVVFIKGLVSEVTDDSDDDGEQIDALTVDGRLILLTEETHVAGRGDLAVGALVHVVARADGEQLTALQVTILPLPATRTIVLRGRVTEYVVGEYLVVQGAKILVNEETVIEGDEPLAVDAYVTVRAQVVLDDAKRSLVATYICVHPEPRRPERPTRPVRPDPRTPPETPGPQAM